MNMTEELKQYFNQIMKPELDKLENERQGLKKHFLTAYFTAVTLVFAFFVLYLIKMPWVISVIGVIVTIIITLAITLTIKRRYTSRVKRIITEKVIDFTEKDLHFDPNGSATIDEYMNSKIFIRRPEIFKGGDCISGKVGTTNIKLCELHTRDRIKHGRDKHNYIALFKGIFITADLHKNFTGKTIIHTDKAENMLSDTTNFVNSMGRSSKFVKLQNTKFKNEFAVYSTDETEAQNLLTPSMTESIIRLRNFNGKAIILSFLNSTVNIAISTKRDLFEINVREAINDFETIKRHYSELLFVLSFLGELKLNTKILLND